MRSSTAGGDGVLSARPACFRVTDRIAAQSCGPPIALMLDQDAASALGALLPLLGCGEEAAALAFGRLTEAELEEPARHAMHAIAAEERVHDAMLRRLLQALPAAASTPAALRAARRFHIGLGHGAPAKHLARIAAVDAAVCTILNRLLRPGAPLCADHAIHAALSRICGDEARHVRISRGIIQDDSAAGPLRDVAAAAREALADLLAFAGAEFEILAVDPGRLLRDIRRLPDGLVAR